MVLAAIAGIPLWALMAADLVLHVLRIQHGH